LRIYFPIKHKIQAYKEKLAKQTPEERKIEEEKFNKLQKGNSRKMPKMKSNRAAAKRF